MKIKKAKIHYYVLYLDRNTKELKTYDIFNQQFKEEIAKLVKNKTIKNKRELLEWLKNHLRWRFSSRCQWEFLVSEWPPGKDDKHIKVNAWQQIEPNLEMITNQVINKMKIDFKEE